MDVKKIEDAVKYIDNPTEFPFVSEEYHQARETEHDFCKSVLKYSGELPVKEYPECTVGGHTPDNCPQCAKAYYYQQGIDDCTLAIPAIVEKAVKENMLTREEIEKTLINT